MKKVAAVILGLLVVMVSTGCQARQPEPGFEQDPSETPAGATLPPPEPVLPDDTIRVAMRTEDNLNPIDPKHYATSSLLRLVYEPLFDVSGDGRMEAVLASSYRWSADGLECSITLSTGRLFHDGRAIGAQDALASLDRYVAVMTARDEEDGPEPADSAFFQPGLYSGVEARRRLCLENIASTSVNGRGELVIGLEEPDPSLVRFLTFPVIPLDQVHSRSMDPVTGSGKWRIESSSAEGMVLTSGEPGGAIRRIEATAYPTAIEAAGDFDRGAIDLLLMDTSETALYGDRSRIRKQYFEGGGFVSLFFSGPKGSAMGKRDALLYVLSADPDIASIAAPHSYSAYPVSRGDFRLQGKEVPPPAVPVIPRGYDAADEETTYDEAGKPVPRERPAFHLMVPAGFAPESLIDRLSTALSRINQTLQVRYIDADDWPSALLRDPYDAALLVDTALGFPDPADYLDGLETLGLYRRADGEDRGAWELLMRARLSAIDPVPAVSPAAYADAVFAVFESLPVAGLASTGTMVWYSRDIEGTMSGTWHAPYHGVEDLLLWRR